MSNNELAQLITEASQVGDGFSHLDFLGQTHCDWDWSFEEGRKYSKLCYTMNNGQTCAKLFIDVAGDRVYRADSWKKRGRVLCTLKMFVESLQLTLTA